MINTSLKYFGNCTGGEKTHKLTIAEMPSHNHGWGYALTGTKGNNEWSSAGSNKTGTANDIIQATGGSQAHNNLQPYLCVYIFKRTA